MKKAISVLLTVLMLVGLFTFAVNAEVLSYEGTQYETIIVPQINNQTTKTDITQTWSTGDNGLPVVTLTSTKYDIEKWNLDGLTLGVDYKFLSTGAREAVIQFLKPLNGTFLVNAVAKAAPGYTDTEKDNSGKSPATGAHTTEAVALMLIAAGSAVLALSLKKKRV